MIQELIHFSSEGGSLFVYKGSFTKKPSMAISNVVEDFISNKHIGKIKRKTLFFLIEITQNIEKYSLHDSEVSDLFMIYSKPGNITIESQNVVDNSSLHTLKEQLDDINNSNQEKLKEMFTTKLSASLNADKKSPGLGFIELKRKNKKSFDYSFEKIDEKKSLFSLKISIEDLSDDDITSEVDYREIDTIKEKVQNENEIIVFSGDLEGSTVAPIVKLIEKLKFTSDINLESRYQHSLIELLQNSKEHSKDADGLKSGFFTIKKQGEKIKVACCNHSEDNSVVPQNIEELNSLDKSALEQKSKETLLDFNTEGGLGLIQVANLSHPSPLLSKSFYNRKGECFLYIECSFG